MIAQTEQGRIAALVQAAHHIVIIQADNPDADSLGSALALEHILGDQGKHVSLYCGVDMPGYLRYLAGWDRVGSELPRQFDLSIIVDASTLTLLEKLQASGELAWLAAKPCIILDHHATVDRQPDFAKVLINDDSVSSSGELIYQLAQALAWPVSGEAAAHVMTAILGDTQGLSNDLTRPSTYRVMAELAERGVNRPQLEEQRREFSKLPRQIYTYKAQLIERTEFAADGRIAHVTIPQQEINDYSPLYNPAPLVQGDMLSVAGVGLAIVFKQYDDGHVTAAIRANTGWPVADELAEKLGGGGHPYASGFKTTGRPLNEVRSECLMFATELLNNIGKDTSDETLQHANA
ncbi:MAG TPA: DHH family phosphoesterase [Candidatus Saccharimonadales bacterium]|nr:DHH family phosphoesterase [Candidatus Saccharimonadales bacterium]